MTVSEAQRRLATSKADALAQLLRDGTVGLLTGKINPAEAIPMSDRLVELLRAIGRDTGPIFEEALALADQRLEGDPMTDMPTLPHRKRRVRKHTLAASRYQIYSDGREIHLAVMAPDANTAIEKARQGFPRFMLGEGPLTACLMRSERKEVNKG